MARTDALTLLTLVGLGSITGRFLLGTLADKWGRRRTLLGCCWGIAAATAGWSWSDMGLGLSLFSLVFGVLYGGFVALLPAFTVDVFGRHAAGAVLGVLYTGRGLALLVGPPLIAFFHATSKGHSWPLAACACAGLAGTMLLARVRPCGCPQALASSGGP
jgi:MFS family permease